MAYRPACAQLHICHNQTETVIPTHNSAHNDRRKHHFATSFIFLSFHLWKLHFSLRRYFISYPILSSQAPPTCTQYPDRPTHSSIVFSFLYYVLLSQVPHHHPPTTTTSPPPPNTHTQSHTSFPQSSATLHPLVFSRLVSDCSLTF